MPTPEAVDAPTIAEVLDSGTAIVQMFGLMPFVLFAAFAFAAFYLFKKARSAAR